jgi:hypothetical protein
VRKFFFNKNKSNIMEQLICKFKLPMIEKLSFIDSLVSFAYRRTDNKFSVNFHGSKGYLSNIEIQCEGYQPEKNNIIWVEKLRNKDGSLKSKMVSIYHSEENGIRIDV